MTLRYVNIVNAITTQFNWQSNRHTRVLHAAVLKLCEMLQIIISNEIFLFYFFALID